MPGERGPEAQASIAADGMAHPARATSYTRRRGWITERTSPDSSGPRLGDAFEDGGLGQVAMDIVRLGDAAVVRHDVGNPHCKVR